ncbi:hypothetical protein Q9233_007689, partial [Columba guinea]
DSTLQGLKNGKFELELSRQQCAERCSSHWNIEIAAVSFPQMSKAQSIQWMEGNSPQR